MVNQIPVLEAGREDAMIISLLYHDVVPPGEFASSGFGGSDADSYKLEVPEFEYHLDAIRESTPRPDVKVLGAHLDTQSNVLFFTFDDGGASAVCAAALLEARGWRGHFFIPTDYIGKPGFLTPEQIRSLHARGHVVGSHSCSHPVRMSLCPRDQLAYEWKESARVLTDLLGAKLRVASVPGGYYSKRVSEAAEAAGIEMLFTSEPTSRIARINDCRVIGRYSIRHGMPAETAARIASADWSPRMRQYVFWNCKKLVKRLGGSYYLALRKCAFRTTE
jgi:peptidoglycan/xylan/chitin deacetylase (PgdA/CDA1 family)